MSVPVLLVDADNTLWDTDSVFASAQIGLLDFLESATGMKSSEDGRLEFVRRYDQAIARVHHAHFRYPVVMLVSALLLGLQGISPTSAAEAALRASTLGLPRPDAEIVDGAVSRYASLLREVPNLLPTVQEGVQLARERGFDLYVVTEGKIEVQRSLMALHKLSEYVRGVFEITKVQAQFQRLSKRFAPAPTVMIGDQLDRDIAPARSAGCLAVLVPGRFRPVQPVVSSDLAPSYTSPTFAAAIDWVYDTLCR